LERKDKKSNPYLLRMLQTRFFLFPNLTLLICILSRLPRSNIWQKKKILERVYTLHAVFVGMLKVRRQLFNTCAFIEFNLTLKDLFLPSSISHGNGIRKVSYKINSLFTHCISYLFHRLSHPLRIHASNFILIHSCEDLSPLIIKTSLISVLKIRQRATWTHLHNTRKSNELALITHP